MSVLVVHRLDQPGLGRLQQLGDHGLIEAARPGDTERRGHVDAQHPAGRHDAELPEGGREYLPGLVLFEALRRVFAIRAGLAVQAEAALGAGRAFRLAGFAVSGPAAGLEVPSAEGPDAFFADASSTWRSVNS